MSSFRMAAASILRGSARPNRADRGIYAGRTISFGNKITPPKSGHTGGPKRTQRRWLPNVQTKRVTSNVLGRTMRIRFTTHALRCIDKAGGFDNYILNTKDAKLDSDLAVSLKREMQAVLAAAGEDAGGENDLAEAVAAAASEAASSVDPTEGAPLTDGSASLTAASQPPPPSVAWQKTGTDATHAAHDSHHHHHHNGGSGHSHSS
eukprot:m.30565 g.30565  ORF g.30565 m.30565 type:complete len:206 (-) comp4722_c0_seq2:134-751(-)